MNETKQSDVVQRFAERLRQSVLDLGGNDDDIERTVLDPAIIDSIAKVVVGMEYVTHHDPDHAAEFARNPEIRRRAIGNMRHDEQVLFHQIAQKDSDVRVRRAAVARIQNERHLTEIAVNKTNADTALDAVARIDNPKYLQDIVTESPFEPVRALAARRLAPVNA